MRKLLYALVLAAVFTLILWMVGPAENSSYWIMAGFGFGFGLLHKFTEKSYDGASPGKTQDRAP